MNEDTKAMFLDAAEAWLCDGYALDIRFLAYASGDGYQIWDASVALTPFGTEQDTSFQMEADGLLVGLVQRLSVTKEEAKALLFRATEGILALPDGKTLAVAGSPSVDLYSEMTHRDRWFAPLHLRVTGERSAVLTQGRLATLDNALRTAEIPFDGLSDVAASLGLSSPYTQPPSAINVHVLPPVDLVFEQCLLANDQFQATLHAHPELVVQDVGLAVRVVPGIGLAARRQISDQIRWGPLLDGRRAGTVKVTLRHADSVLAMLTLGVSTVRRQWFLDPAKARNSRLLAIQHFDKDLNKLKQGLFDAQDSQRFELGVASLLFLLGFTPGVTLETESPDLVVETPRGRLAVVECTTKISDFANKVGKLVDRRGALSKALLASGHLPPVLAALVCRAPRDQIAARSHEVATHGILLIAREDLESGLERLRFPNDPDRLLDEATQRLNGSTMRLEG